MKCNGCKERPRYRHTLTVQTPGGTADASGHVDLTSSSNWTAYGTIKGRFISKGGREWFVEDQTEANASHMVETPSTSLSRGITPTMRMTFDSRVFYVESAQDVDESRDVVRIMLTEAK